MKNLLYKNLQSGIQKIVFLCYVVLGISIPCGVLYILYYRGDVPQNQLLLFLVVLSAWLLLDRNDTLNETDRMMQNILCTQKTQLTTKNNKESHDMEINENHVVIDCINDGFCDFYDMLLSETIIKYCQQRNIKCDATLTVSYHLDRDACTAFILIKDTENPDPIIDILIKHPPIIGYCWSNQVARRLAIGQIYVSAFIHSICVLLEEISYELGQSWKIIGNDDCYYAPLLYFSRSTEDNLNEPDICYIPHMVSQYPSAFERLEQCGYSHKAYWGLDGNDGKDKSHE